LFGPQNTTQKTYDRGTRPQLKSGYIQMNLTALEREIIILMSKHR